MKIQNLKVLLHIKFIFAINYENVIINNLALYYGAKCKRLFGGGF
ncbi:hypothetical protein JM83_1159 [Gillisia sp. Hel_I_86]|nr:hypothetical protein JM83_1159 [Gillisia sp. Hel_I_86]